MNRSVLVGLILTLAMPANGQWLRVSSADVAEPGDTAEVCVSLEALGTTVAATQNDLIWDGTCATLESAETCAIAPGLDQQLFGRIRGNVDFGYRGLVLSLTDISPIPDGTLYCCPFRVEAMPRSCCAVSIEGVGLSDQYGNQLGVAAGPPAQLCVGPFDGTPFPTSTPTFTPTASPSPFPTPKCPPDGCVLEPDGGGAGASASADSGGCHVTHGSRPSVLPTLFLAVALLLLGRRL